MRKQIKKMAILITAIGTSILASGEILAAPAFLPQGAIPGYSPVSLSQGYATFRPRYNNRAFMPSYQPRPNYYYPQPMAFNGPGYFPMPYASMPANPRYASAWTQQRHNPWSAPARFNSGRSGYIPRSSYPGLRGRYMAPAYRMNPVAAAPMPPRYPARQMAYRPQFGSAMPSYRFRPQMQPQVAMQQAAMQQVRRGYPMRAPVNPAYRFRPWTKPMAAYMPTQRAMAPRSPYPAYAQAPVRQAWPAQDQYQFRPMAPPAMAYQQYNRPFYPQAQPRLGFTNPGAYRYRPDPRFINPVQQGTRWPMARHQAPVAQAWQGKQFNAYKWRPLDNIAEQGLAQVDDNRGF